MTRKQRRLMIYVQDYIDRRGDAPTVQEMTDAFGYASKGRVFEMLTALEDQAYIARTPYRARAIHILRRITPITSYCVWDQRMKKLVPYDAIPTDRVAGQRRSGRESDDLGDVCGDAERAPDVPVARPRIAGA